MAIDVIGEVGTVTSNQSNASAWYSVQFAEELTDPVVVAGPLTRNGGDPTTVRLRNVTDAGFEWQMDEWDYKDGGHITETFHWMAVQRGTHTTDDGRVVVADSATVDHRWSSVALVGLDAAPVVLSQTVTTNGSTAVTTRMRNVSADGFDVQIEEEEAADSIHADETVDYIAIGAGVSGGWDVGVTPDAVTHRNYVITADAAIDDGDAFLAAMQTTDGGDSATTRLKSRTGNSFTVHVEEEKSRDNETGHTTEVVGYVAMPVGPLTVTTDDPVVQTTFGNGGVPWPVVSGANTRIEAENYDVGGPGISYNDTDAGNNGGSYRSDDVDVHGSPGNHAVGWFAPGEWLEYTIDADAGTYDIDLRVAALSAGQDFRVLIDGVEVGRAATVNTRDWQIRRTITVEDVAVSAGGHVVRVESVDGWADLDWIEFRDHRRPTHRQSGDWTSSVISGGGYIQNVLPTYDESVYYTYVDVAGVWRSDDAGFTWRDVSAGLPAYQGANRVRGLLVHPGDLDRLVAITGTYYDDEGPTGIFVSRDGGETWTQTQSAWWHEKTTRFNGFVLRADPDDPDRLYALSDGDGLFISDDFGDTWTGAGLTEIKHANHIEFDPNDPSRMWAMAEDWNGWDHTRTYSEVDGGLWRSDDSGQTWTKLHDDVIPNDADGNRLWGDSSVPKETVAVDLGTTTRLIGIFDNVRVKTSDDGGQTWTAFEDGLLIYPQNGPIDGVHSTYVALESGTDSSGNDFVLLGDHDGFVYRWNPGASGWTRIDFAGRIEDDWWGAYDPDEIYGSYAKARGSITIDPRDADHWFATDWFSIWQTFDAGSTWERTTEGIEDVVMWDVTVDPNDPDRVYVGMADIGFFISDDRGQTFRRATENSSLADTNNDGDIGISGAVTGIVTSPTAVNRVYALSMSTVHNRPDTVMYSDDRGEQWTPAAMNGIPADRGTVTLVVREESGADVLYVSVAGSGVTEAGGIYRSVDGGENWTSWGTGLDSLNPSWTPSFFRDDPWKVGNEFDISGDGSAVAVSWNKWEVYALDTATETWRYVDVWSQGFRGHMNEVKADPHVDGRFYIVGRRGGLWQSDDGGWTWNEVTLPIDGSDYGGVDGPVADQVGAYVELDPNVPSRLALATRGGIYYRPSATAGWQLLNTGLPEKFGWNMMSFAEDRLIVGTGGSGTWWIDLPA